jgi:hypothetical protein
MKYSNKILTLLLAFVLVATSCEDNFLDVNTDPNNPSTATMELVLPAGQMSVAFALGGQGEVLGSFWAQHWTQSTGASQYGTIDDYNLTDAFFNNQYQELYAGALNDLNFVSKKAEEAESWNYFLIAETMKAYVFQVLVDLYDKVPYTQALQGTTYPTPVFDNGDAIYTDLLVKIDAALAKDRSESTEPGDDDIVFQGNMDNWVRFANTLKLKILMRQSEARPSVAEPGIQALFASGATFLETDAEVAAYIDVENFRNPYYAVQVSSAGNGRGNVDVAASTTLMGFLQSNGDPRVNEIYNTPIAGGAHASLVQGNYNNPAFGTHNNLSQPNVGPTHPVVFIGAAESKFLQAEAVERYSVTGNAEQLYQQGIDASFAKHGLGSAAAFYAPGGVYDYNGIESIIEQKWVSTANFNALESHFEHLRTGFPDFFTITPNNVTGNVFPKRLPYTQSEVNNNGANLRAIGGQKQVIERVWWDPS